MKKCNKCLEEKELKAYDKYRNTCRKCRNEKNTKSYLSKEGNVDKIKEYQKEYQKKHRENNPYYKLYCQCLWELKSKIKSKKSNELKEYIETLFTDEMNWDNYGIYWEIDHINSATKMAKAGYTIDEINKLSNLRPLAIKENRERFKLD
jgi:PHP family Zn ribbon phosphoesterase